MINPKSLREQVYEFLRQELSNGKLVPGSAINLSEISQQLGISKTPMRDALIQLEVEGFVTISPRRGFFVTRLSLDEIRHCYEIVGALETAVILSNFDRIDGNRVSKMKWLNSGLRTAIEGGDFEAYYELNLAFHDVFLELSDNAALRRVVETTKQRLYDFPRRGYILDWELENCNDHQQLIEALEKGDRDLVKTVWMEGHWSFAAQEKFIRRFYFPDERPPALDEPEGGTGRQGSWNDHLGERNDPSRSGKTVSGSRSTGRIPS